MTQFSSDPLLIILDWAAVAMLHGVHTYCRVDRTSVPVTKSEAGTRSTQPGHLSLKCVSTEGVNCVLQYAIFIA